VPEGEAETPASNDGQFVTLEDAEAVEPDHASLNDAALI
jgi:hypothetical protein